MKATPSFEAAIAFAADLIRIPGLPGQEGDVANRVLGEFEALGFDDVWRDGVGNVFGRIKGRGSAPAVMLNSHLDCVDVGDVESWEYHPFGGVIEDGFLHGRGAMDIKGPLALQTHAAATFLDARLPGDVIVGHTVLEERGGWGMQYLLEQNEVRPAAVIIGESTDGDVCIGHRGRAEVIVELQGVAGHASAPERARNPIALLLAVLPIIERFGKQLPANALLGASTIAPTALETLPRSRNVIPDRVRIVLDWRVLPEMTAESAVELLRRDLSAVSMPDRMYIDVRLNTEHQKSYMGLERNRPMFTPGFTIDAEHPIVLAARDVVAKYTGRGPQLRPWSFATDGGHACGVHGIPCIGFAPGQESYAHTNRERLPLDQARSAFGAYPALIAAVQSALA